MKSKLTTCISNDFKEGLKAGKQKERQRIREEIEKMPSYDMDESDNMYFDNMYLIKSEVLALLSEEEGK